MEKQLGTVLIFKPGTTKEQAEEIIDSILSHLDHPPWVQEFDPKCWHPIFT
jgi:hypothetical protein